MKEPDLDELAKAASAVGMKVGLDFDGTVSHYPQVMASLVQIIGPKNCHLITARRPQDEKRTFEQAREMGFPIDEIAGVHHFPEEYEYEDLPNDPELWKKLVKYKVKTCKDLGIGMMIEDDEKYKEAMEAEGISFLRVA